jgi:hypothetical protein
MRDGEMLYCIVMLLPNWVSGQYGVIILGYSVYRDGCLLITCECLIYFGDGMVRERNGFCSFKYGCFHMSSSFLLLAFTICEVMR